ncbi:MAG: type II toxin-antitoxin system RelE/ParE family toxin [Candidatus Sericytochromatia bacterium]|nr:type II toxin-antitoxin system RelE/ParE family toxin [Candidatus Tanganyikabacteria bacterium]
MHRWRRPPCLRPIGARSFERRYQSALDECIEAVAADPERFPEVAPGVRRRLVLHRFPFAVIYRIQADEVQVIAVMHLRRRPGYWRS